MLFLIGIWQIIGAIIILKMVDLCGHKGAVHQSDGIEFVNPAFVHKHNRVNWFGAFVVATLYGLICPVATIGYWFYKICTFGVD